jgi:hypothetical protein
VSVADDGVRYTLTARAWAEIGGTPPRVTREIGAGERWELTDAGRALLAGAEAETPSAPARA